MEEEWRDEIEVESSFETSDRGPATSETTVMSYGGVMSGELKIFFQTKASYPEEEEMRAGLDALVRRGECIGYDLTLFHSGVIRVLFNPIIQNETNEQEVLNDVASLIRKG